MKKNIIKLLVISLLTNSLFAEEVTSKKTAEQEILEQKETTPKEVEKDPKLAAIALMPVDIIEVKFSSSEYKQNLPGRVAAYRTAEVRARVSGIIIKRNFEEGTKVEAGQLLFNIEDKSLKAILRARSADVATAVSAYDLSEQTLKRYKELLKVGAVSVQEYDTYAAQTNQSKSKIEQAKANQDIAEINLAYASVKAPIYGRINQSLVTEGALATADITKMATIEQIDKVYVDFTRSSSEVKSLKKMMQKGNVSNSDDKDIKLLFDDGSEYKRKGKLEFSAMRVDKETGSISLRAIFDNPGFELLPGMFVRVEVPVAKAKNVIKVPQKAVTITRKGANVYIIKDTKLVALDIKVGQMIDNEWVVLSGLKEGDEVVISDTSTAINYHLSVVGVKASSSANKYNSKDKKKEASLEENKLKKVSAIESDINSVKNINKSIKDRLVKDTIKKEEK